MKIKNAGAFSGFTSSGFTSKSGFTLIELLVVMAIIGVLVIVAAGSFQSSQTKARDAQRKSDLKQIGQSLETYYNDYGQYPLSSVDHKIIGCDSGPASCEWGEEWSDDNGTIYMSLLPADSRSYLTYYYDSDGTYYQLYARLENDQDGSIPTSGGESSNYGIECGSSEYLCNFGVASSNTTPAVGRTIP